MTRIQSGRRLPSDHFSFGRLIAARHIPALSLAALGLALAAPVQARVIEVFGGDVTANDPVQCSIVDAFVAANTNTATGACPAGDDATNGGDTLHVGTAGSVFNLTGTLTISSNVTLQGNGSTLQGNNSFRILTVNAGAAADVRDITVTGGNYGSYGGGIFNQGTLTLTNSTVSGNSAGNSGGGIHNQGTLTLSNSTVSGNSAASFGAGIVNRGSLTLTNSTVSGNSANIVGGIVNSNTMTLTNSTVSGNSTVDATYGTEINGVATAVNTIIAGTGGNNCYRSLSGSNNLSNDSSCGTTISPSLNLQPLANNGGPTQTLALGAGSSAIDAGASCTGAPVNNLDQRGFVRDAACDVGAYEFNGTPPPDTTPDAFSFTDNTNAPALAKVLSDVKTITGIDTAVPISVSGTSAGSAPAFSINGAAFVTAAGTVNNNDTVQVRTASSATAGVSEFVTLTVGTGFSTTWTVISATDTTPNAFTWGTVNNVAAGSVFTTGTRTIGGINAPTTVVSVGGDPTTQYQINNSPFSNAAGTIVNSGDTIRLRVTAGALGTSTSGSINIGGTTGTLTLNTPAPDTTPNAFSFTNVTGATPGRQVLSNAVTIAGINTPTSVSIAGDPSAQFSINSGPYGTTGTVNVNSNMRIRLTAPAGRGASTTATLTVGTFTAPAWTVTTAP